MIKKILTIVLLFAAFAFAKVSTETYLTLGQGDGNDTTFSSSWSSNGSSEIKVYLIDSTDKIPIEQSLTTHYSVTPVANNYENGNVITFGTAPTATQKVVVYRDPAFTQTNDLSTKRRFDNASVVTMEGTLDKLVWQNQRNKHWNDTSLKIPEAEVGQYTISIPNAATRAGKRIGFDDDGHLTLTAADGDTTVHGTFGASWAGKTYKGEAERLISGVVYRTSDAQYNGDVDAMIEAGQAAHDQCVFIIDTPYPNAILSESEAIRTLDVLRNRDPNCYITGTGSPTLTINSPSQVIATGQLVDSTVTIVFTNGGDFYMRWFSSDGASDEDEINAAITSLPLGTVHLEETYTTDGTINMKSGVNIKGLSGGNATGTIITYSGSGSAVKFSGISSMLLSDINIICTNDAASAIEAGTACKRINIVRVYGQSTIAATTTGSGFLLAAGSGWSGGLSIRDCYMLGFKYGIKFTGTHLNTGTWTTVDVTNTWLVGRSAGIVTGSAGVYFDALTNGIGTYVRGGTIESFALGVEHLSGGRGGSFNCDFEDNTAVYSVADTFNGIIKSPIEGNFIEQGTNGATNKWLLERHLNGAYDFETYTSQRHTIYNTDTVQVWGVYSGGGSSIKDSWIDGDTPEFRGGFEMGGSVVTPQTNRMRLGLNHVAFASAAPTGGSWRKGDRVFDTTAATTDGWRCDHSGTFGAATDSTGDTDGSTAVITGLTDTSDFGVDHYVDVSAGFATTGPYRVLEITSTTLTLDTASNSAESNITIDTSDPNFAEI